MPFQFLASVSAGGNLADLLQHLHVRTRVSPGPHPLTRVTARVHTLPTAAWHIATHFLCPCLTIFLHKFNITNQPQLKFRFWLYGIHVVELCAKWHNRANNLYYHNDADPYMHFICMYVPLTLTYFVMHFRFCSVKHFSTIVTSQSSVFTSSTGVSASVLLVFTTTVAVEPWCPMSFLSL